MKDPVVYTKNQQGITILTNVQTNHTKTGVNIPLFNVSDQRIMSHAQHEGDMLFVANSYKTYYEVYDLKSGKKYFARHYMNILFVKNETLFGCRGVQCYKYDGSEFAEIDMKLAYIRYAWASVLNINNEPCVIGGSYDHPPTECLTSSGQWYVNQDLPNCGRSKHISIMHDRFLYMCGGEVDDHYKATCTKYDLVEHTNSTITGFPVFHVFDMFILNDKVIVVGLEEKRFGQDLVKYDVNDIENTRNFLGSPKYDLYLFLRPCDDFAIPKADMANSTVTTVVFPMEEEVLNSGDIIGLPSLIGFGGLLHSILIIGAGGGRTNASFKKNFF